MKLRNEILKHCMIRKVNTAHPYLVEKIQKRMWTRMNSLLERKNEMGNDYFGNLGALTPIIQAGLPIVMQLLQVNRHLSGPSFITWSSSLWREPWQVLPSNSSSSRLLADLHIFWLTGTLGALQSRRGNKFDSTFPRGLVLCSTRGCFDIFRVVGYTMKRCKRCKVDNRRRALFSLICQFDFVGDAWRDAFSDKSVKWVQLKGRLWGNWNNEVTGDNPFK